MDIKQLIYFVEIAKEKSFTRAAANCYISQPALSKSIRQLEEELNSKLFIRDYTTFELTREGEILFADATEIISIFNNIKLRLELLRTRTEQPVKIAASPLLGNACFGSIIAAFCEQNPELAIDYYETDRISSSSPSDLKEMDLSILLLPRKAPELPGEFQLTDIIQCSLVGLVPRRQDTAPPAVLNLSVWKDTIITAGDVLHIIYANEYTQGGKKHVFSSSGADLVQKMALQKEGVLILPDFIARSLTGDTLYQLGPLEQEIVCRLVLITKRSARCSKLLDQLRDYIIKEFCRKYEPLPEGPDLPPS
ncbi:HTH-type transcriptional regulator HdfR [bioreactor metagenome]|uniref:HTH-type transcriptional regulator HdfR n=1 Tax=bioreactor metagenome TaxID=1076179 RepID=A0A645BC83_9ZZZZ